MSQIGSEKYINIWFGLYHKSAVKSVGKNPWQTYCRVVHLCQDNLYLLQTGKNVLFNNFISYLKSLNNRFLMHLHLERSR